MKIIYNKPLYIDNISNLNILIKNYSCFQRLLTREDRQRIYNEYTRHDQGAKEKSII